MTARTMIYIFSHNYELSVSWVAPAASFLYNRGMGTAKAKQYRLDETSTESSTLCDRCRGSTPPFSTKTREGGSLLLYTYYYF